MDYYRARRMLRRLHGKKTLKQKPQPMRSWRAWFVLAKRPKLLLRNDF